MGGAQGPGAGGASVTSGSWGPSIGVSSQESEGPDHGIRYRMEDSKANN